MKAGFMIFLDPMSVYCGEVLNSTRAVTVAIGIRALL
jgi:hypothetical protein